MLPATCFLQTLGSIRILPGGSDAAKAAQDVLFRAEYWPKILLTAVFFSPIMQGVKTESGIGGKNF
jgi:hypothetical protein